MTISAIIDVLESSGVSALRDDLPGMKDEERHGRKGNLNRMKKNRKNCKKATCPNIALRR